MSDRNSKGCFIKGHKSYSKKGVWHPTEEQRKKISERKRNKHPWNYKKKGCYTKDMNKKRVETRRRHAKERGYWETEETSKNRMQSRRRNAEARGYWISEEGRQKQSKARIGTHPTPETIKKMSKPRTEEHKQSMRHPKSEIGRQHIIEAMKGRPPPSVETKLKMSKAHIGNTKGYQKGHKPWQTGLTKETDIRLKIIGDNKSGPKHHNFKNWKSREPYGQEFSGDLKKRIRIRDSYCCQKCNIKQEDYITKSGKKRKLCVHHIDYDKKNNDVNNLISLCLDCHMETNFGNEEDWMKYFMNKMVICYESIPMRS